MVSLSAVELCVGNAERLLIDSTKTTSPTAAALAELSIEEASKAWMLYFRTLFQGRTARHLPRLSRAEAQPIADYFVQHADYLAHLDREILDAFRFHKVKLRFLSFLLGYVKLALPVLSKKGRLTRLAQEVHGPAFNIQEQGVGANTDGMLKLIDAFRLESLTELHAIKERGFYVDFTKSGDLVSPDIEPLSAPLLGALAAFLITMLKGDLVLLTK
jgi:hypothetical protein